MDKSPRAAPRGLNADNQGGYLAAQRNAMDPAELFDQLDGDADAAIRLLYADDTAAEPLWPLLDPGRARVPIALIEPTRNGLIQYGEGIYDVRISIAAKMGLPRAEPTRARTAKGWTLGPNLGRWELIDPTGALIANCAVNAGDSIREPAWTAQAMSVGEILAVYGARVGVRVPEGVRANRYDDQRRADELFESLAARRACAATVQVPQQIRAFRRASTGG